MEVGKLIQNVAYAKVNMTLSVKPFGCMPSSSVSDGVQSFITELYPQGIFLPIETNGDGAVNVYSRVQMQLFKAKQLANKEVQRALDDVGMTMEEVQAYIAKHPKFARAFHRSPHVAGCTTVDLVHEVAKHRNRLAFAKDRLFGAWKKRTAERAQAARLIEIARQAAAKARAKSAVEAPKAETAGDRPAIPEGRKSLRVFN